MGERYNLYFPEEAENVAAAAPRGRKRPLEAVVEDVRELTGTLDPQGRNTFRWSVQQHIVIRPAEKKPRQWTVQERRGNGSVWNIVRNEYPGKLKLQQLEAGKHIVLRIRKN